MAVSLFGNIAKLVNSIAEWRCLVPTLKSVNLAKLVDSIAAWVAGSVVSSTVTVWSLEAGAPAALVFEVWLADTVPAWLAVEEVALPEFADSELWLAAGTVTWVDEVAWLAVAAALVALAAWLLLACDPLTTPVAGEPALGVVLVTLSVWFAGTWVAGVAWLAVAAELVALAIRLLLAGDPLATPVADEPALGVVAALVAAWATGAWLARL